MGVGTILFVHGSGNRSDDAEAYGATLRARLGLPRGSSKLRVSRWGDECGPDRTFPLMSAVLPPVEAGVTEEVEPAALDSMEPLRQLAAQPGVAPGPPDSEERRATAFVLSLLRAGAVDLSDIGVSSSTLAAAAEDVASSPVFRGSRPDPAVKVKTA